MKELCRRPRALPNFLGLRKRDWSTKGRLNAFRRYGDFPGGNQPPPPEKIPLGRGGIVRISESPPCLNGEIPFSDFQELGEFVVRRRLGLPTRGHFSRRSRERYSRKLRKDRDNPPDLFLGPARVVFVRRKAA